MRGAVIATSLMLGVHVLGATSAGAQTGTPVHASSSDVSMTPHRLAADTGRMAWGHQDYTRYTGADPCDRAVADVAAEVWRTHVIDTLAYDVAGDTLPAAARAVARACGRRFQSSSAPDELWSVLRIALALNDEAHAAQVVERLLSLGQSPAARATTLVTAISTYLGAHPPRISAAQALLQRLDALGVPARSARYEGHLLLLSYWRMMYVPDSVRAHANAAIALLRAMPAQERDEVNAWKPYFELIWLDNDTQDLVAEKAVIDSGVHEVGPWRDGQGARAFQEAQRLLDLQTSIYGKRTRPLKGPHWYNTGGAPHPAPGVVSLIVHLNPLCGIQCLPLYVVLRQLRAHYGAALDLTLVTDTRGFAPGTGPLLPAEEADQRAHYYIDTLRIPAALLVDESPVSKALDGHMEYEDSPVGAMFDGWRIIDAVLIDRAGKVQWLGMISSQEDKRMVEAAIDRAMGDGHR